MDQEQLANLLCKIPNGVFNLLYLGRRDRKDSQMLNAKLQFLCKIVEKQSIPIEQETIERTREQLEFLATAFGGDYVPLDYVEDFTIQGPGGTLPVRLYKPVDTDNPLPVLVYFHGGGFIRGSINSHDGVCRRLAKTGGFAVMSVEYRLAPESVFPAAVDDAYAALRWAQEYGAEKGLDTTRVAVGGDSSGGNLATVAAQDAKRNNTPQPAIQMLIYPITDAHFSAESHKTFSSGYFLTSERMNWYRDNYLTSSDDRDDPRASPFLTEDLEGLAPTLIMTAGFDPLRDEGEEYAQKLKQAGVPVGVIRYEGMLHSFASMNGFIKEADEALKTAAEAVSTAFKGIQ
ncbi:hypothetical protein A9Q83_08810 [Alphaproteobacteria bacterium 46_93_T64]|nr:hypothetical protein A9Q83_08810 [Alphaproteobacteria bacterium 46_93_T64]